MGSRFDRDFRGLVGDKMGHAETIKGYGRYTGDSEVVEECMEEGMEVTAKLRGRKLLSWLDKHGGIPEHRKSDWLRDARQRTRHGVVTSDVAVLKSINVSTQRAMSMKTLVRESETDFRAALIVQEDARTWHEKINKRLKKFRINLF